MAHFMTVCLIGLILRDLYLLAAIFRSRKFIASVKGSPQPAQKESRQFFVFLPMLRETSNIESAVRHFNTFKVATNIQIVIITTERERVGTAVMPNSDTIALAAQLAINGRCIHIHYPRPDGLKGDQLNYALACLAKQMGLEQRENTFVLIYDADSRPQPDTLEIFNDSIDLHPNANIFHQSSIFQIRAQQRSMTDLSTILAGAGALRANRFVFAHELRKLLNRVEGGFFAKRVYTHVTGHGLCGRLSFFLQYPFPGRTPIEDMEFSYELCVRGEPMIPVKSLDNAEVPQELGEEFRQLSRWFSGPGRFLSYFRRYAHWDPVSAFQLSASAALISLEWLSCLFVTPFIFWVLLASDSMLMKFLIAVYCGIVFVQLLAIIHFLNKFEVRTSLSHLLLYPLSCMLFGLAGMFGTLQILANAIDNGKTER